MPDLMRQLYITISTGLILSACDGRDALTLKTDISNTSTDAGIRTTPTGTGTNPTNMVVPSSESDPLLRPES
jgi:hypothetical protein